MLNGDDVSRLAHQRPDWLSYVFDSIVLERVPGALQLFDFPVESPAWQRAQQRLAVLWKCVDLQLTLALLKKPGSCPFAG